VQAVRRDPVGAAPSFRHGISGCDE